MILGFKTQFVKPILSGQKIHTIREDKINRWKIGCWIHFATGVRTKNYKCFKGDVCSGTQDVEILYNNKCSDYPTVIIDGKALRASDKEDWRTLEILAKNDGFPNFTAFCMWFDRDFKGKIIHWTNFKY